MDGVSAVDRAAEALADAVLAITPDDQLDGLMTKVDHLNAVLDGPVRSVKTAMSWAAERRDQETRRKVAGVRVNPNHWASAPVHAHRTWTGQHTMETWCGLAVDLEDGARQTTDLISCLACGQGSWLAFRNGTEAQLSAGATAR